MHSMSLTLPVLFLIAPLVFHKTAEIKHNHQKSYEVYGKTTNQPSTLKLMQKYVSERENKTTYSRKQSEDFQEQEMNELSNASHFVYEHPLNNNNTLVYIKHLVEEIPSNKEYTTESIQFDTKRSGYAGTEKRNSNCTSIPKRNNRKCNFSEVTILHNQTINKTDSSALNSVLKIKPYIDATIVTLICIVGLVGNTPLFIIFIRHAELRTVSNIYIFTIAAGDFLCIIINLLFFLLFFLLSNGQWNFGIYFCKFFFFASDLSVALSIFGLSALSIQRYRGIMANPFVCSRTSYLCFSKRMKVCDFLFVWAASFLLALRTFITADVVDGRCLSITNHELSKIISIVNFVIFAIFPLILLVVFHLLTARFLFASAKTIPGADVRKQNALKCARKKSARMILALTFVFFISYVPWFLWQIIFYWAHFETDDKKVLYCFWILYYLFFGSVCFNPIALYCISSSFRRLFQHYLCICGLWKANMLGNIVRRNEDTITDTSFTVPEEFQR